MDIEKQRFWRSLAKILKINQLTFLPNIELLTDYLEVEFIVLFLLKVHFNI